MSVLGVTGSALATILNEQKEVPCSLRVGDVLSLYHSSACVALTQGSGFSKAPASGLRWRLSKHLQKRSFVRNLANASYAILAQSWEKGVGLLKGT